MHDEQRISYRLSTLTMSQGISTASLLLSLLVVTALHDYLVGQSLQTICQVSLFFVLTTVIAGYVVSGRNFWSFSVIYLMALGVFHFGLVGPFALGIISSQEITHASYWWLRPSTGKAVLLTTAGYIACGTGIALLAAWSNRRGVSKPRSTEEGPGRTLLSLAGAVLTIGSILSWFYIALSRGGIFILTGSYDAYLSATRSSGTVWVWFFLGLGVSFLAASPPSHLRAAAFGAFLLLAIFALPIGLRGEVMFSASAALVILARHRRMPSTKAAVIGMVVLLVLISLLREVRQVGVGGVGGNEFDPGITAGLVEMGGTIRTVAEVVHWRVQGDSLIYGASYWAPFDRAVCQILHPWQCVPAAEDERIMNVLIQNRLGPYGFSPIAEAFRNFGAVGVVGIMLIIGLIVAGLDSWAHGWKREAAASVVFVELLINVRNDFVAIPAHLAMGMALVLFLITASYFTRTTRADFEFGPMNTDTIRRRM